MKKTVMKKWVKALRSGKYKQGFSQLRWYDQYCCLGVLCDVSKISKWTVTSMLQIQGYLGCELSLPRKVVDYAGMISKNGIIGDNSLSQLNDSGMSFSSIADYIEQNWKDL